MVLQRKGPAFSLALFPAVVIIHPIMIIDFHTHIYPDHLAARTLYTVRELAGIRSYTDGTLKGLLGSMAAAGIDLSVVHSVATKPEHVHSIHEWLPDIRHPGIHVTAATYQDTGADPDRMRSLKAKGFKGFKVHPDFQGFFVDDRRMYPFYEAAREEGMFILFHAGVDRGLPNPVHATPKGLAKVRRDFPGLVMIAAHMGGEYMYDDTEEYLLGQDIYLDTSFVLRTMTVNLIQRFMDRHPAERFLFGSDTPWRYQAVELDFLLSLPFIGEEAKEMMTYRNAAGLLDL